MSQAQRYRHRVTLQERVSGQDPQTGEIIEGWQTAMANGVTLESVPAEVLTGPGRELLAAGATQAETAARINMYWFPGLEPTWRILWDGKIYNIESIETDATARREYRLRCTDGVNNG